MNTELIKTEFKEVYHKIINAQSLGIKTVDFHLLNEITRLALFGFGVNLSCIGSYYITGYRAIVPVNKLPALI